MSNYVSYAEFHAPDLKEARAFYEGVFGWQFQSMGSDDYFVVSKGEGAGIDCGFMQSKDGQPRTVCTIQVPSLDSAAQDVREHGGQIVVEKFAIPNMGHALFFTDPGGQIVGLFEPDKSAA